MESPNEESSNEVGATDWTRRRLLTAVVVLPVVASLLIALAEQLLPVGWTFPCPLYPNASVAFTSLLDESCPLAYADQIDAVVRGGRVEWTRAAGDVRRLLVADEAIAFRVRPRKGEARDLEIVPVRVSRREAAARLAAAGTLAAILVATVLLTAVRAGGPASLPLSLIHAAAGVAVVSVVAASGAARFEIPDALARATMAGAVLHLGLVFPQRCGIVERSPQRIAWLYAVAYVVSAVEIYGAYGGAARAMTWAQCALMLSIAIGVGLLAIGCLLCMRRSPSHLVRGQARVLLAGVGLLAIPMAFSGWLGTPRLRLATVTVLAALLPFSVGCAISRYAASDLDASFRRLLAQGLHLSLASVGLFLVLYPLHDRLGLPPVLKHPAVAFAGVYCALLPLEAARGRLEQRVRTWVASQTVDWERIGCEFARRIAAQRSAEGVAREVAEAVRAGLGREAEVAVLVEQAGALHVVESVGARSCVDPSSIAQLLPPPGEPVVDLNRLAYLHDGAKQARDAGVCALARLEAGDDLVGCIAVLHDPRSLSAGEREWVAAVAGHAATALTAMRLEQALRVAERFAARGRMEAELAHDIAKPLGALELTAQKLTELLDPSDPVAPHLARITRLAQQVRALTRAALESGGTNGPAKLEDIVQAACLEVRALHGEERVVVHALPDLGELPPGFGRLARALVNLLDNAIRASEPEAVVELRAWADRSRLELQVDDRGHGMTRGQLRRAFEPFASFRTDGTGLGLSISRQIVTALGGSLSLEPRPDGRGVRAIARLPLSR